MLSKKYKHGDKVVITDSHDPMKLRFGEVLEITKLLLNRDKEDYRTCMFGMHLYSKSEDIVICRWDDTGIAWCFENHVRPATKAEKILYGERE